MDHFEKLLNDPEMKPRKHTRSFFLAYLFLFGLILGVALTNTFSPILRKHFQESPGTSPSSVQPVSPEQGNAVSGPGLDYEQAVIAATRRAIPAVVSIYTSGRQYYRFQDPFFDMYYGPQAQQVGAMGSGVIVDPDGTIITNEHVISSVLGAQDAEIKVELPDGRGFVAQVQRALFNQDIAILKIDAHDLPYVELSPSADLVQGQTVLAIGNPYGFSSDGQPTVTRGIISATKRNLQLQAENGNKYLRNMIQTDSSINEGNSGGALIDLKGRLVGINTAIFTPNGSGSIGIGFAISSDQVRFILDSVKKYGNGGNITSGIGIQPLTRNFVTSVGYTGASGVLISSVEAGSAGEKYGFRKGDIITDINGFEVSSIDQARDIFRGAFPGEVFELKIFRNNAEQTLKLALGEK